MLGQQEVEFFVVDLVETSCLQSVSKVVYVVRSEGQVEVWVFELFLAFIWTVPAGNSLAIGVIASEDAVQRCLSDREAVFFFAYLIDLVVTLQIVGHQYYCYNHTQPLMTQSNTSYSQLAALPEHFTHLLIENQKMKRQILILEAELSEKSQVILQLKEQLDNTVVEHTQQRLSLAREVQSQVEGQSLKVRQGFYEKSLAMEDEIEALRTVVQQLKEQLTLFEERNKGYRSKIQSLKQYILDVVDEKDSIINELGSIIQQQELQLQYHHQKSEKCLGKSTQGKKRAAIIKNE